MNKIPVIFNGGAYGTYLMWLMNLTYEYDESNSTCLPFRDTGSSHNFNWITSTILEKYHPKDQTSFKKENVLSILIDNIMKNHNNGIYIYPGKNTQILVLNNFFTKIWTFNELCENLLLDTSMFYKNWDLPHNIINYDEIPRWILREFFSINIMTSWRSQIEWNHIEHYDNPNLYKVLVDDIIHDIHTTLYNICDFCGIDHKLPYNKLDHIHNEMLKLQQHIDKDKLCRTIVSELLNSRYYDYSDKQLSLVDESWIQWELRNRGYEMYCDGLNEFPTNTEELDKKIYKV